MFFSKTDFYHFLRIREVPDYSRVHFDQFIADHKIIFNRPAIHITGTNGKGTTARALANIYRAAGYKVGLYTSPHFVDYDEMIEIDGKRYDIDRIVFYARKLNEDFHNYQLTAFEIMTLMAFFAFQSEAVDIAIIEVGMGGKVDATNIFTPVLSIITNVTLEHTAHLGTTISAIATAKAGIIKPHVPVLLGNLTDEAIAAVRKVAAEQNSEVFFAPAPENVRTMPTEVLFDYETIKFLSMPTPSKYAALNGCIALKAIDILQKFFPVSLPAIQHGINETKLPARFEVKSEEPFVIIDGAHNPGAIAALVETLQEYENFRHFEVVFAAYKDKDVHKEFELLEQLPVTITLTTFEHRRSRHREDYSNQIPAGRDYQFVPDMWMLIKDKYTNLQKDEALIITGSLHFAGTVSLMWNEKMKRSR